MYQGVCGGRSGYVVAGEGAQRDEVEGGCGGAVSALIELVEEGGEVFADAGKHGLAEVDEVHFVDCYYDLANAEQRGDGGVAARLDEHAFARVDEHDREVGGACAGGHVAGVLLVAGGVGDDELAAARGEVPVGDIDGDALLAFGAQAIGQESEVEDAGAGGAFAFDGLELVVVDRLGVVEQAADEGGFAVVDRAGGGETEDILGPLFGEIVGEIEGG